MIFKRRQDIDETDPVVSIQARGTDVKEVLADLFTQAKRDFMLNSSSEKKIYLSVRQIPFTKALQMVCEAARLRFTLQDEIYIIEAAGSSTETRNPEPQNVQDALKRRVSLKVNQMGIRAIAAGLSKQSGVPIELDKGVPNYRINAKLPETTLEAALHAICSGTGLKYEWTDQRFKITRTVSAAMVSPSQVITLVSPKVRPAGEKANPRTAPVRNVPPSAGAVCPKCRAVLEREWNYCPLCGAWVKPVTQPK